jgi:hypothetical protein
MFTDRLVKLIDSSYGDVLFRFVPTGNWEPGVSTQYCGIWTGMLADDRDLESVFHLVVY